MRAAGPASTRNTQQGPFAPPPFPPPCHEPPPHASFPSFLCLRPYEGLFGLREWVVEGQLPAWQMEAAASSLIPAFNGSGDVFAAAGVVSLAPGYGSGGSGYVGGGAEYAGAGLLPVAAAAAVATGTAAAAIGTGGSPTKRAAPSGGPFAAKGGKVRQEGWWAGRPCRRNVQVGNWAGCCIPHARSHSGHTSASRPKLPMDIPIARKSSLRPLPAIPAPCSKAQAAPRRRAGAAARTGSGAMHLILVPPTLRAPVAALSQSAW